MWYRSLEIPIFKNNFEYLSSEFKCIENFVKKYLECKEKGSIESCREKALSDFRAEELLLEMRLEEGKEKVFSVALYIRRKCRLSKLDWFALMLAAMVEFDESYKELILKVENASSLTYNAILKLYFFTENISEIENSCDVLAICKEKMNYFCFVDGVPKIDPRLYDNLINNFQSKIKIPGVSLCPVSGHFKKLLTIREETAAKVSDFLSEAENGGPVCLCFYGEEGIGKKTLVNRICGLKDKDLIYINIDKLKGENFSKNVISACREAFFIKGWVCFYGGENLESGRQGLLNLAAEIAFKFCRVMFVLSKGKVGMIGNPDEIDFVSTELPELTIDERFKLWKEELKGKKVSKKLDISELSGKFALTPKQIRISVLDAAVRAEMEKKPLIDSQMISSCVYNQMTENLSEKATLIKKKHTWDELILNPDEKAIIKRACDQLRYRRVVYDKWKMGNRILYGTGLSMLFAGPSGTGKTMAAQVVAHELGLEIYKVDLSRVISKYIGESEKNLGEIFDSAKKSNVILLFDETDSIFAKRTEVKDSHDRNANLETSYLLQKMEEHTGITILTTNFLENIDKAFFRRINYVVHFAFPNAVARKEIWQKMFTKEVPIAKDVDFNFIARQFELSGGSIKNACLTAAFMAASENSEITMKHMIKSIEYEIKKQGKMVSKSDFAEYSYLL